MPGDAELFGVQQPLVHRSPPYARTLGAEAVDLMAEVGKPLDPWQALMVMDTFGLRDDGYWSAFECVGLVPRQNGKGGYTEAVELANLFLFKVEYILHSAHLFKTSKLSFSRIMTIIDNSDWLRRRVHKVTRARGDEEIELTKKAGGGKLLYFSRTGGAGRGFTGDVTVFDECAYLTIEQYQAATPTLSTVPNPQIIYTGTPPDEDVGPMPEDAMMPSVRRRGHRGDDRVALWEWGPPKGYDRTDPTVWAQANPTLGRRIQVWFLRKQLTNFTEAGKPEKFDTEHLGVWPKDKSEQWKVVTEAQYQASQDATSRPEDPVVFCVAMSWRRSHTAIGLAGERADGDLHVEVPPDDHRPGNGWVVARCVELYKKWKPLAFVFDAGGPEAALVPDLITALRPLMPRPDVEPPVTLMNGRNATAAYGIVVDGLTRAPGELVTDEDGTKRPVRRLWHRDDPRLSLLFAEADTRRSGTLLTWLEPDGGDISMLRAVTGAAWGLLTVERPPPVAPPISVSVAPPGGGNVFRPTGRLSLR